MPNESDKYLITRAAAAHMLDCDVRSLTTYQGRDIDPLPVAVKGERRGQSHRYDPQALTKWKVRQEITRLIEDDDGTVLNLEQERARLAKLQSRKIEIDIAMREGQLITLAELAKPIDRMFSDARRTLLAIPTKAAPSMLGCKSIPEAEAVLKTYVHESLNELSNRDPQTCLAGSNDQEDVS